MDPSNTAAAWLSFTVTAIGLGPLMAQVSAIREQMDPFFNTRGAEHLGTWYQCKFPLSGIGSLGHHLLDPRSRRN